ncbi:Methyltransf 31 and Hist deacetyl and tRNA U5-met h tr domain containing protein [Trichuris trichiura]|uniref:tRNA (uracil(54)-C(5))-methyltransferase n=1 Tax=Trichuris trichiura TaxID=36087 RepID=A0A077ZIW4_TRITR|nr:Methyltransf 31 and Hist deacetyl and tRNA U5-met h tr domain containing protein [Trichuris trichiura]
MKRHGENDSEESDSVNITDVVTPWHDVSYEEQLERKHADCLAFLKDVSLAMAVAGKETIPSSRHYGILEDIRASPKENGYRNKCEFSVGYNNGYAEIGFRLTRHREGCTVAAADDCKHIPTVMKSVVRQFRNFILSSGKAPYDVDTKEGFWRMLTVRCYEEGTLIIITVNPSGLDATCIAEIKKEVVNHFLYQDMTTLPISSIYYQELLNSSDEPRYELLSGSAYVYEKLFDMRFCILPSVFFQVNTKGCEVLYSAVEELCKSTKADVLLDIFCGTGALGLCLAKNYKHVIGIDLNKEAIENAKANASANKINHCDYFCGQLENLIFNVLELDAVKGSKCVAVLTPTRAEIDQKVIIALRECKAVLFLVYISCNIMRSKKNMIDLHPVIRPPGHHAMADEANEFCLFNNVGVRASFALKHLVIRRILIVDWDVHYGQGKQKAFYEKSEVLCISIHRYEHGKFWPRMVEGNYDSIGTSDGKGFNINIPLNQTELTDVDYLAIFQHIILLIAIEYEPELVFIAAGFDAAVGCSLGGMRLNPNVFGHLTNMLMPIASNRLLIALEGGYCIESLSWSKQNSYRSKCEFLVEYNNRSAEVGFRLTCHKEHCMVAAMYDGQHILMVMKFVVSQFRNLILPSGKAPYDVDTKERFWRMLTVRCYEEDILIVIRVNPSRLDSTSIAKIKNEVVNHFLYQDMMTLPISSVYYQELVNSSDVAHELLGGCLLAYEKLFDIRFRILLSVFFQLNTKCCEVLYGAVEELRKSTKVEVLLDICCGRRALGLCLAKNYKHVIRIELVKEAIKDVKANASANEMNYCEYFCRKLENLIFNVTELDTVKGSKCVSVLIPTRAGIDQKVITALLECKAVLFLIYLS